MNRSTLQLDFNRKAGQCPKIVSHKIVSRLTSSASSSNKKTITWRSPRSAPSTSRLSSAMGEGGSIPATFERGQIRLHHFERYREAIGPAWVHGEVSDEFFS